MYHLHGHVDLPESIVLTEDDHLDFLVTVTRDPNLLPHYVKRALSANSLVFIGYRLADWDFRVIHRGLMASVAASLRRLNITVQLPDPEAARDYLNLTIPHHDARSYTSRCCALRGTIRSRPGSRRRGRAAVAVSQSLRCPP